MRATRGYLHLVCSFLFALHRYSLFLPPSPLSLSFFSLSLSLFPFRLHSSTYIHDHPKSHTISQVPVDDADDSADDMMSIEVFDVFSIDNINVTLHNVSAANPHPYVNYLAVTSNVLTVDYFRPSPEMPHCRVSDIFQCMYIYIYTFIVLFSCVA